MNTDIKSNNLFLSYMEYEAISERIYEVYVRYSKNNNENNSNNNDDDDD